MEGGLIVCCFKVSTNGLKFGKKGNSQKSTGVDRFPGVPDTGILHFTGVPETGTFFHCECVANPWCPRHRHFTGVRDTGNL